MLQHQIDTLRRIMAGQIGFYIRRSNEAVYIGPATTDDKPTLFFWALHRLYVQVLVNPQSPDTLRTAKEAHALWLSLPLPKDINLRWAAIRNEIK